MKEIAPLTERDYPAIMELHREMGFDYELDPGRTDFIVRNGLFDSGKLVTVVLGRATTEAYLLMDKKWSDPRARMDAIEKVTNISSWEAKMKGYSDTHVWIPPKALFFTKRLHKMGFSEAPWPCLTARL